MADMGEQVAPRSDCTKRPAARIGPTVCELDGPIPILKMSNTLIIAANLRPHLRIATPKPTPV